VKSFLYHLEWHRDAGTYTTYHAVKGHSEGHQTALCGERCEGTDPGEKSDSDTCDECARLIQEAM